MERHEAQVRRTALVDQDPGQAAEMSNKSGLGFGFGVQYRPEEDVLQQGCLGRRAITSSGNTISGTLVRSVILAQDIVRDGARRHPLPNSLVSVKRRPRGHKT